MPQLTIRSAHELAQVLELAYELSVAFKKMGDFDEPDEHCLTIAKCIWQSEIREGIQASFDRKWRNEPDLPVTSNNPKENDN